MGDRYSKEKRKQYNKDRAARLNSIKDDVKKFYASFEVVPKPEPTDIVEWKKRNNERFLRLTKSEPQDEDNT